MTKTVFLKTLEQTLINLGINDRADILYDYEEHFRIGEENGKTEAELIEELGDPENIARQYAESIQGDSKPFEAFKSLPKEATSNSHAYTYDKKEDKPFFIQFIAACAMLLFNLIFVVGPYFGILGGLIGLFGGAIGITVGGFAMVLFPLFAPLYPEFMDVFSGISSAVVMSAGVGTTALGLLFFIGLCYLSKYFGKATIKYLKWNLNIITR